MRAMVSMAVKHNVVLDKSDERIGYIIQMHELFVWNNEKEFMEFVEKCIRGLSNQVTMDTYKKAV